ncbi:phosphatidate cytidylyltransferase [Calditrichota bacterium]
MSKSGIGPRLLVVAWGIPAILSLSWLGGWWTTFLIVGMSLFCLNEYYRMQIRLDRKPLEITGMLGGIAVCITWLVGPEYLHFILLTIILITSILGAARERNHTDIIATLVGVLYIPFMAGSFIYLRDFDFGSEIGRYSAVTLWGAVWVCDIAAFLGGRALGKTQLAPKISPKKTVEGFGFGLAGAILFSVSISALNLLPMDIALVIGFSAGLIGQLGDLVESLIKREADIKDAGTSLPGHGGFLDRFDSFLTTTPVVAMYLFSRAMLHGVFGG